MPCPHRRSAHEHRRTPLIRQKSAQARCAMPVPGRIAPNSIGRRNLAGDAANAEAFHQRRRTGRRRRRQREIGGHLQTSACPPAAAAILRPTILPSSAGTTTPELADTLSMTTGRAWAASGARCRSGIGLRGEHARKVCSAARRRVTATTAGIVHRARQPQAPAAASPRGTARSGPRTPLSPRQRDPPSR